MANSERDSVQQNLIDKNAIALNAVNLHSDVQLPAIAEKADNARLAATPDDNLTKVGNDRLASGCGLTDQGTHEDYISGSCFIVSGLQSLTLNSKDSGAFSLGPDKGSAKLLVPSEAIQQGRELTIRHCTLLDGPFYIPEDCYIVSPVLYIDYNTSLVKNALELHLSHWNAGEDQQKTMTFLKAPHVPDEKGFFKFDKCDGGSFVDDVQFGVLKLQNHLCLICAAVERTQSSSPKCACRVMLLKKPDEDPRIVSFALYLIFDNVEWIEIIETYIESKMGWTKGSLAAPSLISLRVQEQADGREDGVEVTANPNSGPHWEINYEGGRSLPCSQMLKWLERYHRSPRGHCNKLRQEITTRLFPPCIQLRLRYDGDPRNWTSTQKVVLMVKRFMRISPTEDIEFPQEVKVPGDDTQTLPQRILPIQRQLEPPPGVRTSSVGEVQSPGNMKDEEQKQAPPLNTAAPGSIKDEEQKQVPPLNTARSYFGNNKDSGDGPIRQYCDTPGNMKDKAQRKIPSENECAYYSGKKLSAPGIIVSHQQTIGIPYDQKSRRKEVFEVNARRQRDQMSECSRLLLLHCQCLKVNVSEQLMHHLQTRYGGILTCDEAAHVMKETNNARKLRQLIDILREKGDKECHIFCRILGMDGSSSNASWATIVEAPECQAEECTQPQHDSSETTVHHGCTASSMVESQPITDSSQNTATIADAGKVAALPQRVYDHPDHLKLFRIHVSRTAAGKGRAVLEGVGLTYTVISACFTSNPQNEEEAVQLGLIKWIEGQGEQPPTWAALLEAMEYAQIAQQDVKGLKKKLRLDKRS